jgi:ankyrin repeat protein
MLCFSSPESFPTTLLPNTSRNNIDMRMDGPYFWLKHIDLNKLPKEMLSTQQLSTRRHHPVLFHLDPTCSTIENVFNTLAVSDVRMKLPVYLITSLLNQSSPPECPTADQAYAWLKTIPGSTVRGLLRDLPGPILDSLKERIFYYAIDSGDALMTEDMLKLGISPHDAIYGGHNGLLSPLEFSLLKGHALVAKIIFAHMCQDATPTDINRYLTQYIDYYYQPRSRIPEPDIAIHLEAVCMALMAGAQPTTGVTEFVGGSLDSIKQILEAGKNSLEAWLHAGLIQECLYQDRKDHYYEKVTEKVVTYIFRERFDDLAAGTPMLRATLIDVIKLAVRHKHIWAIESVLQAFHRLKFRLDDPNNPQDILDHSIIDACRNLDWTEAALLLSNDHHRHFSKPQPEHIQKPQPKHISLEEFLNAVRQDDQESIFIALKNRDFRIELANPEKLPWKSKKALSRTMGLANDRTAVKIVQILEDTVENHWGIMPLLESGRTAAISALLKEDSLWNKALRAAKNKGDFRPLEDAVYSHLQGPPYMELYHDSLRQQLSLRLLAYHATEMGDEALYRWLLENDIDDEELIVYAVHGGYAAYCIKRPTQRGMIARNEATRGATTFVLPPLLAVAAKKDASSLLGLLVMQKTDCRDSRALWWAVRRRIGIDRIGTLLKMAEREKMPDRRPYGSAALREAIKQRDHSIINTLLDYRIDIDVIDCSSEDWASVTRVAALSPMGEAILLGDSDMVKLLLRKYANPNALVAHQGLGEARQKSSVLSRLSPLLAAIEVQNLEIVKLLREHGAEIDYTRRLGLLRTPLQRASEIGNFEIVQYLVAQGSQLDTPLMRSGATAFQLASMNGHVDIALFLLNQGADVNHPPAEGDGRTAFEAAAEWGRIDMMALLMQQGVDLNQKHGTPAQSQYERAKFFAKNNCKMASARYVDYLHSRKEMLRTPSLSELLDWTEEEPLGSISWESPMFDFSS